MSKPLVEIYMRICRAANTRLTGEAISRPKHPTCLVVT